MPVSVFATLSNLSLFGFCYTAGFYSKEIVLENYLIEGSMSWSIVLFLFAIGLTSCYSFKMLYGTILIGSRREPLALEIGGYGRGVKVPLMILGLLSITFGGSASYFGCSPTVVLNTGEKLLPIVMILVGVLYGNYLSRLCRPFMSSIILLTPFYQTAASFALKAGEQQKEVDKGWIERASLSTSPLATSIITHYTAFFVIGIGVMLVILFYG